MRFWDLIRGWFGWGGAERFVAALSERCEDLAAALSQLTERHEDLVRQIGEQQNATAKQLTDLRQIIAAQSEQAKQKAPMMARSMADVRRFIEGEES